MKQKKLYHFQAFTMVELMIVVVIIAILSTVGFIAYEDYLVDTRDSKRVAQITGIRDALRLQITQGSLPIPDNAVEIRNNGVRFLYQGYAGESVLEYISYTEGSQDPKDDRYYTYLLSENKNDFQLMSFQEKYNPEIISSLAQAYAAPNYTSRFPFTAGKKLGILLEQSTNIPLQELVPYTASGFFDLATDTTNTLFDAYVTDTYLISGSGSALIGIIPYTTCKKILQLGHSYGNGPYTINPTGINPIEVYCLMTEQGGGWTMVMRQANVPGYPYTGAYGWSSTAGSVADDNLPYSMGLDMFSMNFAELLVTGYTSGKNIGKFMYTYKFPKSEFMLLTDATKLQTFFCTTITPYVKMLGSPQNCTTMDRFGDIYASPTFFTEGRYSAAQGLNVGTNFTVNLNGEPAMFFVR